MKRTEVQALAESVRAVLDAIDASELSVSTATRYRLEGALVALRTVLDERSSLVDDLVRDPGLTSAETPLDNK